MNVKRIKGVTGQKKLEMPAWRKWTGELGEPCKKRLMKSAVRQILNGSQ